MMSKKFLKVINSYSSKENRINITLVIALLVITIFIWIQTINIPYWWDSAGFVINAAKKLVETNFWPILPYYYNDHGSAPAHPPLFILSLAGTWKIFGESLLASHLVNLFFILLLILYTYKIGKELIKNKFIDRICGFSAAILLLFTPVFTAQMGIIYLEIPVTAFAVMAYYYFFKKKYAKYLIAASLMALTKEISLYIIFIFLILANFKDFLFLIKRKKQFNLLKFLKNISLFLIPFFLFILWFAYYRFVYSSWWVLSDQKLLSMFNARLIELIYQFKFIAIFIFIEQGRIFLSIVISLALAKVLFDKKLRKDALKVELYILILIPFLLIVILTLSQFLHRYIILGLPFFYLLFSYSLILLLKNLKIKIQIFAVLIITFSFSLIFYFQWNLHRNINSWHFSPLEENLEYLDIIDLGRETASYIEKNYSNSTIYTSFPLNYMLNQPYQHFVVKSFKTYECYNYKPGKNDDLIVFNLFSPGEISCGQLIVKLNYKILKVFNKNGKYIFIAAKKELNSK